MRWHYHDLSKKVAQVIWSKTVYLVRAFWLLENLRFIVPVNSYKTETCFKVILSNIHEWILDRVGSLISWFRAQWCTLFCDPKWTLPHYSLYLPKYGIPYSGHRENAQCERKQALTSSISLQNWAFHHASHIDALRRWNGGWFFRLFKLPPFWKRLNQLVLQLVQSS